MPNTYLSIIIPAYNEEKNIEGTLSDIEKYLLKKDFEHELILIDDGSIDWTVPKAQDFKGRLKNFSIIESKPNRGKGHVIKKAMLEAKGECVLFMDADNSTSIRELDKFLPVIARDIPIYIASRRISGSRVDVPLSRRVLGFVYIFFSRVILGLRVSDINCGFKIYRREVIREIFSKQLMNDWSFDAEDLFIASKRGYRIKEVPVEWAHKNTSKVRPLKDGINSFISLAKIRANDLAGKYI